MPKQESPLTALTQFLPANSFEDVADYLRKYKVHLTITRERSSILGNYRNPHFYKNHRISVNGNLNKYSFLITLLHELAHLLATEKHGTKIPPHGRQWKDEYRKIILHFMDKKIFPAELESTLLQSLDNPAATTCAEPAVTKALMRYDKRKENHFLVEELPPLSIFKVKGGGTFKKGERLRKRFKCTELGTGKIYLFSPIYQVEKVS